MGQELEEWRPIPGWESFYEASDQGHIRSLPRTTNNGRLVRPGKVLTPSRNAKGYLYVTFSLNGRHKSYYVHLMVLAAFRGPRPENLVGCHFDDDKENNAIGNLRWDTVSANLFDKVRNGNHHEAKKTHCPAGHSYSGANLITGSSGRECRTCKNAQHRARRKRDKENAGN